MELERAAETGVGWIDTAREWSIKRRHAVVVCILDLLFDRYLERGTIESEINVLLDAPLLLLGSGMDKRTRLK